MEFREGSRQKQIKEEEEDGEGRKVQKKGWIGKYHGRNKRKEREEEGDRHSKVTNGAKRDKDMA